MPGPSARATLLERRLLRVRVLQMRIRALEAQYPGTFGTASVAASGGGEIPDEQLQDWCALRTEQAMVMAQVEAAGKTSGLRRILEAI
jgi:hypothetical protein